MTETLALPEPDVTNFTTWVTVDDDGYFSYILSADWTTWQTWELAIESGDYDVNAKEYENYSKFSAFVLQVKVLADEDYDAACFNTPSYGALCFMHLSSAMDTYRLSATSWAAAAVAVLDVSNTDFTSDVIDNSDREVASQYMDYAVCNDDDADTYFECKMWQPNWRVDDDGVSPITMGYPRLGTEETGITAGYYDAAGGANIEDVMNAVTLTGAAPALLLAGYATLKSLLF